MLAVVPGCRQILGLEPLADSSNGDDGPIAGAMCVGDTLHTPMSDTACLWACVTDGGAHCGVPHPTGGGVMPGDLADDPSLMPVVIDRDLFIDSDTGVIPTYRNLGGVGVVDGIDFQVRGNVAVFRFASLAILQG